MRRLLLMICLLAAMFLWAAPCYADSPITSTDFYTEYMDVEMVKSAAASGKIDADIAQYLSATSTPIDQKAAVINALGWDVDGKDNAEIYANLIYKKPVKDLDLNSLNGEELFVLGYLLAMDDYFDTAKAAATLQKSNSKMNDSFTVAIITAVVASQETDPDQWGNIWEATDRVLTDEKLKQDMRPEAVKIIVDYMSLYKDDSGSGETMESGSSEVYSYAKIIRLVIGAKEAEVNYMPTTMDQPAFIREGRTLVPLRFLGESLGAKVSWEGRKNEATVSLNDVEVKVIVGSKAAYIDQKLATLEVPAEIRGGRVFIPLRFVTESLGAWVDYQSESQTVRVRYVDISGWKEYTQPVTGLKFKYPGDWKVKDEQDYVSSFTAPNRSQVWVYILKDEPEVVLRQFKANAINAEWELDSENFYDPENPGKGGEMFFSKYDYNVDDYLDYFVYADYLAANSGSYACEMIMEGKNVEIDNVVMLEIFNS